MRDTAAATQVFDNHFVPATYKHISYLYSQSEPGLRHPDGPVGWIARDQGQMDLYAGQSRLILDVQGNALISARQIGLVGNQLNLNVPNILGLTIAGQCISPQAHAGQLFAALQGPLPDKLGFVTSDLQIDMHTGRIISGFVSAKTVLKPQAVFEQPKDAILELVGNQLGMWLQEIL